MSFLRIQCRKCGGSGEWQNPNRADDRRPCFACNGTGDEGTRAGIVAPRRSSRRPAAAAFNGDFFLDGPSGDAGAGAGADGTIDIAATTAELTRRLSPLIRSEIADATTRVERDVKGWRRGGGGGGV